MALGLSFLTGIGKVLTGLAQGFAFGTGYGSGVRFGFEDVYPYFKGHAESVIKHLFPPNTFTQSGFKQASGITKNQGFGFSSLD